MDSSYANQFATYWDASTTELQYSQLMQTIPATTMNPDEQQINIAPPLYRPYNHFPTLNCFSSVAQANGISIQSDGAYKSAFKPVVKRLTNQDDLTTMTQMFVSETSYFNSSKVTITPTTSNSSLIYGQSQMPILYNTLNLGVIPSTMEVIKDTNNFDATLKNDETSYNVPTQLSNDSSEFGVNKNLLKSTAADYNNTDIRLVEQNSSDNINSNEKVFHWDTLLPLVLEPMKRSKVKMPPKSVQTRKRRLKAIAPKYADVIDSNVPVIDLTSSEDFDECIPTNIIPSSVIESNKTPPLDINGNEILITTNTKTMQAISYKKAKYTKCGDTKHNQEKKTSSLPELVHIDKKKTNSVSSELLVEKMPQLYANLTQNDPQSQPIHKQIKFVSKYNRYMGYFRRYNGFRLFMAKHYLKAQSHAPRDSATPFIQSILLKWWNAMSSTGKEQYAQMAEKMHRRETNSTQNAVNDDEPNVSIIPVIDDFDSTSTSEAVDVNVSINTEADDISVNNSIQTTSTTNSLID